MIEVIAPSSVERTAPAGHPYHYGNTEFMITPLVGNGRILGSLGNDGQLHRLWWPQINSPHHVNEFLFGVYVENLSDGIAWLNSESWTHHQHYLEDTNCLVTTSKCKGLPIVLEVMDFCLPDTDTFVRNVVLKSQHQNSLSVKLYVSAAFAIAESTRYNAVYFDKEHDALVFYRHSHAFAVGSERECSGYEAGKERHQLSNGPESCGNGTNGIHLEEAGGHKVHNGYTLDLNGNQQAMGMHGALSWSFTLSAEESLKVPIFLSAGEGCESAIGVHKSAKSQGAGRLLDTTILHWNQFLQQSRPLHTTNEKIVRLFKRSLLVIKLLCDKTGAIAAAPEFDEDYKHCGGYSFCWGRDAAYICSAIDQAGYPDLVTHFYDWTVKAQSPDGSWGQRHFMDGRLAPQWGFQVDETGSIVWGMWQHYQFLDAAGKSEKALEFAERIWGPVKRAGNFLTNFIDHETKLPRASMDLWEERLGQHLYSAAAVYGGLKSGVKFAILFKEIPQSKPWDEVANNILDAILKIGWSEEQGHFFRTLKQQIRESVYRELKLNRIKAYAQTEDKGYVRYYVNTEHKVDTSLLGLCVPFDLIPANETKMLLTANAIRERLTTPHVGGLKRYEDDDYAGGNPWIVTTSWMGLYDLKRGEVELSLQSLLWTVNHQTSLGLLPEQIHKETGETAWVVPLTWSHAMYILHVVALDELKAI
ncbi:hypothetical protein R1sor_008455 [Riccia sorocarpa]|uniref:GH15-like domain-containing protein n=1 Tax=Riccia sorocarpa TaxID=122646 RepID=A0ABD3HZP5_9MARC